MTVAVTPATFTLVDFDSAQIAELIAGVAAKWGLPDDLPITVKIDEGSPLTKVAIVSTDPPVLAVEGGAFEAARSPRHLNPFAVCVVAARTLGRVRDRRDPAFGAAVAEDDLTVAQADVWDAYVLGRAQRLGVEVFQPRWRYRFRTRHGFSDAADRVFDRLWAAEGLTWSDLEAACAETAAARESSVS